MHILYVCNEYPPVSHGGIGIFVQQMAHQLVTRGHQVTVVGYDPDVEQSHQEDDQGVHVYRLAMRHWPALRLSRYTLSPSIIAHRYALSCQVRSICQTDQVDLVESYDWSGPLCFSPHRPLIVRLHGANTASRVSAGQRPSRLLSYLERRNLLFANNIIAVSHHIGQSTMQALHLDHPYQIIYHGVDVDLFQPDAEPRQASHVLFVGRIHPHKGLDVLFRAWPHIVDHIPGVTLTLIGSIASTSYQHQLLELLPVHYLTSVQFTGHIPHHHLPERYARATVAVFPSQAEAFGLACIEAMACATPVVMTNHASGPELIEHGVSGLLASPVDPAEWVQAITYLLTSPHIRQQIGKAARQRVIMQFNQSWQVEQSIAFYREVLDG